MSVITATNPSIADVRTAAQRHGWRLARVPKGGRNYEVGFRYHLYGEHGSMFAKSEQEAIDMMETSARHGNRVPKGGVDGIIIVVRDGRIDSIISDIPDLKPLVVLEIAMDEADDPDVATCLHEVNSLDMMPDDARAVLDRYQKGARLTR